MSIITSSAFSLRFGMNVRAALDATTETSAQK